MASVKSKKANIIQTFRAGKRLFKSLCQLDPQAKLEDYMQNMLWDAEALEEDLEFGLGIIFQKFLIPLVEIEIQNHEKSPHGECKHKNQLSKGY